MSTQVPADEAVAAFIRRWESSAAAERANFQSFANELCDVLAVPRPDPSRQDERDNAYVYDKAVHFDDGEGRQTTNWIDLYKRGCFIMEAKQGSTADGPGGPNLFDLTAAARAKHKQGTARRGTAQWDAAMKKAKGQALGYVHALPPEEGNPPFIIVVDVGYTFEVYADFSRLGKTYSQFPDAQTYRIALKDLADETVRDRLAAIWLDPLGHRRRAPRTRARRTGAAQARRPLHTPGLHCGHRMALRKSRGASAASCRQGGMPIGKTPSLRVGEVYAETATAERNAHARAVAGFSEFFGATK